MVQTVHNTVQSM